MALKTRVKVSEVHNLHDGRYCAGMGVEMIGFPLDKEHPNFVDADKFKEIASWLAGIKFVAEINQTPTVDLGNYEAIDFLQTDNTELIKVLKEQNLPIIFKINADKSDWNEIKASISLLSAEVDFFILESNKDLNDQSLKAVTELAKDYEIFLGFGVTKENINNILEDVAPAGIALKGAKEIKVGLNDFDELADILEELDADEFV